MKKKLFILTLTVVSLMACLIGAIATAGGPGGHAGKSNTGHLYFCQKDPALLFCDIGGGITVPPPCNPLNDQYVECSAESRAWGKMKYNLEGQIFDFEFEGHHLMEGQNYTLIYYPDNPSGGLIYLGSDIAAGHGNVHIKGSLFTGNLPASYDFNYPDGAKIWLALSSDVCMRSQDNSPNLVGDYYLDLKDYLFGIDLITFKTPPEVEVCDGE